MNFLAGTLGVRKTLEYLSKYSWGMPSTGTTTDWSRTGVLPSDLRTTPFVPNGVAPWGLFLMAPVLGLGSVVGSRSGVVPGLDGPGVLMSIGTGVSVWGSGNSNLGGVSRKDSPGTSEAVVPSRRSFSVFWLVEDESDE